LAHEVRNALTAVKVDLQRAEEKLDDGTAQRELVSRSLRAVSHLNATVSGALRVARSGTVGRTAVDLRRVLAVAAEQTAPVFLTNAASLSIDDCAEPLVVSGDATALEQLFVNLFLNAAQSLTAGGRVTTTAARQNDHVLVAVTDNGKGISPEHLTRVFEPFFTTRATGTGLGMPIAHQIALAHGGAIEIVTTQVGVGTTVRVTLPAIEPSTHQQDKAEGTNRGTRSLMAEISTSPPQPRIEMKETRGQKGAT
jgi:signal transduction histidine kinase